MSQDKETAFVLPADATPGSEAPIHFGGFPGVWTPDHPIAVSELGFPTLKAAREAKDDFAGVLKETKVDVGSAPLPPRDNHLENSAEAGETAVQETAAPVAAEAAAPAPAPVTVGAEG